MAGDAKAPFELKGMSKYFNAYTIKGRYNTVVATFALVGLGILYAKSGKKKE